MRKGKIIVVDDNEAVLKTLRMILSREFNTVVCVSNPTLLPALLRADDVDVVLLDMNFGKGKQTGGEGLFWLSHIRERKNPPAVVLITAFGDIELAVTSLKKGAMDFIVKPWDNEKLIATIVAAWEQKNELWILKSNDETVKRTQVDDDDTQESLASQLVDFLLRKYAGLYGKAFPILTRDAREKLTSILWTGNIPQLERSIERAFLLNNENTLTAADFYMDEAGGDANESLFTLEEMEKKFIQEVLKEKKGNLTLTAQQLNISRQTLYNKMRKYDL